MRADDAQEWATNSARSALERLNAGLQQGGSRLRWSIGGLIAVALLATAASLFHGSEPTNTEWLYDGRAFPRVESAKLITALKAADIPCIESGGKVGVPSTKRAEALDVLGRAHVGPRPLDDLLDDRATAGSMWELPDDREKRDLRGKEKIAREVISRFRGVVSATVILTPAAAANRLNPVRSLKATALIQTEDDQPLAHSTIDRICHVLTNIDAVDPDAITVIDPTNGRDYRVAGRPDVEARSSFRVREEELREKITNQLRIEGALVHVRIDPPEISEEQDDNQAEELPSRYGVNRPVVTDNTTPHPSDDPTPRLLANTTHNSTSHGHALHRLMNLPGQAYVLVQVPRSHYLRLFQAIHPSQFPTPDDLAPFAVRVRENIQTVVNAIIPAQEMAALNIVRIDDLESGQLAGMSSLTPGKPTSARITVLGGLGIVAATLLTVGGAWLAIRRPWFGPEPSSGRRTNRSPQPSTTTTTTGATERVRELIRLDPGAAAGILQRWIAQGGHTQ